MRNKESLESFRNREEYKEISLALKEAFNSRNARIFYFSCLDKDIDPSVFGRAGEELYERGQLDSSFESGTSGLERKSVKFAGKKNKSERNDPYFLFLEEVRSDGINVVSSSADYGAKASLLIKYFPKRFGKGRKQDLEAKGYKPTGIGRIFNRILEYSRKKYD